MFTKIRNSVTRGVAALVLVSVPLVVPAVVSAQDIQGNLCEGTTLDVTNTQNCTHATKGGQDKVNNLIHTIVNIFSLVVGIVSVIMIIVGGLRYITSGGDSNNVSAAKNTIIYAIIGLVVVALAQFIVQFVLNKVTTT